MPCKTSFYWALRVACCYTTLSVRTPELSNSMCRWAVSSRGLFLSPFVLSLSLSSLISSYLSFCAFSLLSLLSSPALFLHYLFFHLQLSLSLSLSLSSPSLSLSPFNVSLSLSFSIYLSLSFCLSIYYGVQQHLTPQENLWAFFIEGSFTSLSPTNWGWIVPLGDFTFLGFVRLCANFPYPQFITF